MALLPSLYFFILLKEKKMLKSKISLNKQKTAKRAGIVLLTFLLIAVILLINIFRIDYFLYEYYKEKTFDQITTSSKLKAERGIIYDRNMNELATSKTSWRIFISTKEIKKRTKKDKVDYAKIIADGLSEILSVNAEEIHKKITETKQLDVTIKKAATEEEYRSVIKFTLKNALDDLVFTEAQTSRYYPEETLAAHVIGFTGTDGQGLYGLEYQYNSVLAGKDGYYLYAKDAGGNAMPGEYITTTPAEDGCSIVTTIDSYIQKQLETQLELIENNHDVTNRVTGIVMDTESGAILAMATSSPFNPNSPFLLDAKSSEKLKNSNLIVGSQEYNALKSELMQRMWANKAITETYEPGSTFKIVTVSAALDLGVADMNDRFSCHGYHTVGGWRIKCHKTTGHGSGFTLAYGLQMSCNPTMMTLAERIGADNFYEYVEKFGYFEKTGIDLPGEASTIFHAAENIGPTELATASFGQRFKVTIINQLTAIAVVANGGNLVEPYVVEKAVDADGNILYSHDTVVKHRVISEDVAKTVAAVLEEGVSGDGGAKNAYVDGYMVAAKTGTSQKFDILDENGNSYLRIGSTVAFAPSNAKGIAVIIVVDEPQSTVKYGSVVAAPYVSSLLTEILPYLEYKSSKDSNTFSVGNYVGGDVDAISKSLDSSGIKYTVIGSGDVILSQVPAANTDIIIPSSTIYLYTEKRDEDYIIVPSLVGLSIKDANIVLSNAGLNLSIEGSISSRCTTLTVVSQSIPVGARVKRGTVINLTLLGLDFED